jgi:hypothetical protein
MVGVYESDLGPEVMVILAVILLVHLYIIMRNALRPKQIQVGLREDQAELMRFARKDLDTRLWEDSQVASWGINPRGHPLYSRSFPSMAMLGIYENGIKGWVCDMQTLDLRFIPYFMISRINEARVMVDSKKSTGPDIQLETVYYGTIVILSKYHDTKLIMQLLRRCLGERWAEVHKPEVLKGALNSSLLLGFYADGDIHKPAMLRFSTYHAV